MRPIHRLRFVDITRGFMEWIIVSFIVGFYAGFQVFSPHYAKTWMCETCPECGGHGMFGGIHNTIIECERCHESGFLMKKGVFYWIMEKLFKVTCP